VFSGAFSSVGRARFHKNQLRVTWDQCDSAPPFQALSQIRAWIVIQGKSMSLRKLLCWRLADQCWLLQLICLNCCSDSTQQRRNALGLPQWVFVSFGLCGLRILMRFRFSCFDHLTQSKNPPPWRRWQDGFYERKFKPKSASSILGFVGRNWVIQVISWFPNNGNQGSLYLYNARGLFPDGLSRQKPARLALPEMRPTLFGKIPGGGFELNETQTNLES